LAIQAKRESVTLRDVAARAGVSPQTVSNFINGRHRTRPATRERIERAIHDLRYEPNAAARALRSRRVQALAVLLEDPNHLGLHDPLHTDFLHGAAAAARHAGYYLTIALTAPGETESVALRMVRERRADGLMMSLGELDAGRLRAIRKLAGEGLPIVLMQEQATLPGISTVSAQDEVGAAAAVRHLVELGHRRLAFLCGEPMWPGPRRRRDGFLQAAREAGVEALDWRCAAYTVDAAAAGVAGRLEGPDAPTGILAANDVIALGVMQQASDEGLDVPGDLSVVGFNDVARWVRPAITTVRLAGAEMGARAVKLLVEAVEQGEAVQSTAFEVELVVRGSTGPRLDG
jgi:DNA-binding LacI/PurR family transcriptional regulator